MIRHGNTQVSWDEYKDQIIVTPNLKFGDLVNQYLSYDGARELLDCLMAIFARPELAYRYPEVR